MMILTLISQLIHIDERPIVAKKLATSVGADDLIIFIHDKETGAFRPAPGFTVDTLHAEAWKELLDECPATGIHTTSRLVPHHASPLPVTIMTYENKLAVACTGGSASKAKLFPLQKLLPLLASLFHYEQFIDDTRAYIKQEGLPTTDHHDIAQKLEAARRSLRSALQEKDIEIRERIKSEAALAKSEQRFRFMAESLSTMIFTSKPSGDLDYLSPQWAIYTGVSFDELQKNGLSAILHPDDARSVLAYWRKSYAAGTLIEQEVRLRRHDGTFRWHLSRAEPMRNEAGDITMWVGSSTDIEEVKANMEKKLELEEKTKLLTKQQEDLLELNAAKDEFIRLASHQLRTPATGVKMYIGMLMGGYADEPTDKQMQMLDQAYRSNDRQLHIIDDLLKVATVDAGQVILSKEVCDLTTLIADIIEEFQHSTTKRHQQIVFQQPDHDVSANIDRRFIRMVVENLLDNASKYSPEHTTITITLTKNSHSEITITDQGVGIAQKDQDQLFKKFSRVHNAMSISAAGTGLGLYWAKEIITLHGGAITLRSKPKHGSTFIITLP
jgi:PAS domain S-box-containing protein